MERKTGVYVNPDTRKFELSLASETYIDKSNLIAELNRFVDTEDRFVCVSRPRRFGKTMAANMLAAYYGSGMDTKSLFDELAISQHKSYEKYLNQYTVIKLNIQTFLSELRKKEAAERDVKESEVKIKMNYLTNRISSEVISELQEQVTIQCHPKKRKKLIDKKRRASSKELVRL